MIGSLRSPTPPQITRHDGTGRGPHSTTYPPRETLTTPPFISLPWTGRPPKRRVPGSFPRLPYRGLGCPPARGRGIPANSGPGICHCCGCCDRTPYESPTLLHGFSFRVFAYECPRTVEQVGMKMGMEMGMEMEMGVERALLLLTCSVSSHLASGHPPRSQYLAATTTTDRQTPRRAPSASEIATYTPPFWHGERAKSTNYRGAP